MSHKFVRWLGAVGAVTLIAGAFAGVSAATSTPSTQSYTGCLEFGMIFNVAVGSSPMHSCSRWATQISWNQSAGVAGPAGATGARGPKGSTGSQGPKGSTGTNGPQGSAGSGGTVGAQGPKGATGSPGPQGVPGSAGATGPKGSTGSTGATGPKGATGPAGPGTNVFGTGTQSAAYGYGAQCTIGQVILSVGTIANGLPANGQELPPAQFPQLFSLIGTQFGGDGTTGFALPDLNAAAPNGLTYSICIYGVMPTLG
jgi:hypothetical protein